MPKPLIPGATGAAANSRRTSFDKWILDRVEENKTTLLQEARKELEIVLEDVATNGPAWTGASAGRPTSIPMRPNHPAYGMTIGNEPGDSGWQIRESARRRGEKVVLSLVNPMWDNYLKYVEFGQAPWARHEGHFVRDAWVRHLARRGR